MAIHSAKGALLQFSTTLEGSAATYVTVGQVRSIAGPSTKTTVQDVTTHSTAGNWMNKLATLIDPGDLTFPINWDPADTTHQFATGMWIQLVQLSQNFWKLIFFASAGTLTFLGFVTQHAYNVPVDNVLSANIQITVNGQITGTNP